MHIVKKRRLMSLVIVFVVLVLNLFSQLPGMTTVTGKFMIPTAEGIKPYRCTIIITQEAITIQCDKKIFQLFNQFNSPKMSSIKLDLTEVKKIQINNQKNEIYIITEDSFSMRYRNYFHRASRHLLDLNYEEFWILACIIDTPADRISISKELLKLIGERCLIVTGS